MSKVESWKSWEGRVVDGKFPLRQWLGGSDHSAVFLTDLPGQASEKAAIKLMETDAGTADRQLSRLRSVTKLSHPHLVRIFEAGRCQMDGAPVLYAVMEFAEEDLSQILPVRPLAPAEVSDLLPPLLDGLSYLHQKGFVHSRIKPSNVLAVGDQLKLSTDQVTSANEAHTASRRRDAYDAPETAAGIVSPAGDVWSVGVTLVAAMTQNVAFAEDASNPSLPNIPEPFRGIARECVHLDPKRRCSLADIQARLQPAGRSVPVPVTPPPATAEKRRPGLVPILAVVVVAVVIAAVFLSRGKSPSVPAPDPAQQPAAQSQSEPAPAPQLLPSEPAAPAKKAAPSGGGVVHQVIPDVPQSAKNTITGTIKVIVQVQVDASGKVASAKFKSAGPSAYFAGLAMKAAQHWEFSPPVLDGQPAGSAWLLQFHFKRTGTQASPQRITH
jgi:TonB family protein